MPSDLTRLRRAYWTFLQDALPDPFARTTRGNESSRWLTVGALPLVIVHYVSVKGVGVFVRGARGTKIGHVREFLFPYRHLLSEMLGRKDLRLGGTFLLDDQFKCGMTSRENWAVATGWFAKKSPLYEKALRRVQEGGTPFAEADLF